MGKGLTGKINYTSLGLGFIAGILAAHVFKSLADNIYGLPIISSLPSYNTRYY